MRRGFPHNKRREKLTPANAQSGEFVRAEVTVKRRINLNKSLAGLLLYCPFHTEAFEEGRP